MQSTHTVANLTGGAYMLGHEGHMRTLPYSTYKARSRPSPHPRTSHSLLIPPQIPVRLIHRSYLGRFLVIPTLCFPVTPPSLVCRTRRPWNPTRLPTCAKSPTSPLGHTDDSVT